MLKQAMILLMIMRRIVAPTFPTVPPDDLPCKTPNGEDGMCVVIGQCRPEDKELYITKEGKTTQYLR